MAGPDPLARLRAAGFELDGLDDEQLRVLAALSDAELEVLVDVRQRLVEVGPEVEAHSVTPMTIGGLFF
jgi:hypothetical protein